VGREEKVRMNSKLIHEEGGEKTVT